MRILVLGGSGMLGHVVFRTLAGSPELEVFATVRSRALAGSLSPKLQASILTDVDVLDNDSLCATLVACRPDVIINCIGVVKQLERAADPLAVLPINSLLPHRLARLADLQGARLIHISTDCVFRGDRGNYAETDLTDAEDLYGRSKALGEVGSPHVTLRTSIFGRELGTRHGLLEWFLNSRDVVRGYTKAVFSGLSTVELANVIARYVIPNRELSGVLHVSNSPISKHDLLLMVRDVFAKRIDIEPDGTVRLDRSLNSQRFRSLTGYEPPTWPVMVEAIRKSERPL